MIENEGSLGRSSVITLTNRPTARSSYKTPSRPFRHLILTTNLLKVTGAKLLCPFHG